MTQPEEHILAKAGIACCVSSFASAVLNGIDVTKIRMQNKSSHIYGGLFDSMKKIYRDEGFRALTKGMEASMYREAVYSTLRISGYEQLRRAVHRNDPTNTNPLIKFGVALISGGVGSALANPFDLIKTRFQAVLPGETAPYRNTLHAVSSIYKANGFGGLYKGWAVTSARAAVLTSAQLGSYDSIKHNLLMQLFGVKEGFFLHLGVAMISGLITTTASNPLDVIKTRYLSDYEHHYKSVVDCVIKTYKHDGIRGFFKGWTAAYLRIGPHTVMTIMLIEEIRSFLGMTTI